MGLVKQILVKQIDSATANNFVRRWHYSGTYCRNSMFHFGAYLMGILHGVMSFGASLDKSKIIGLVEGTGWNEFVELNRMAFDPHLPRNSESRCIAIALRLIKKHAPHIKWVISFADGTQCGDGTIYRASGFVLTGIKKNTTIWEGPNGEVKTDLSLRLGQFNKTVNRVTLTKGGHAAAGDGAASMKGFRAAGYRPKKGFQLRYIYFLDPAYRARLKVPEVPFSQIKAAGAAMYLGKSNGQIASEVNGVTSGFPPEKAGSTPSPTLQFEGPPNE